MGRAILKSCLVTYFAMYQWKGVTVNNANRLSDLLSTCRGLGSPNVTHLK